MKRCAFLINLLLLSSLGRIEADDAAKSKFVKERSGDYAVTQRHAQKIVFPHQQVQDVSIREYLQFLTRLTGLNIEVEPAAAGQRVSIDKEHISLEEVVEFLCERYDLYWWYGKDGIVVGMINPGS